MTSLFFKKIQLTSLIKVLKMPEFKFSELTQILFVSIFIRVNSCHSWPKKIRVHFHSCQFVSFVAKKNSC